MKTNKSIAKKFKVTASGKLKFRHPGKRHKLTHKSSKRKRHLSGSAVLDESRAKIYRLLIKAQA